MEHEALQPAKQEWEIMQAKKNKKLREQQKMEAEKKSQNDSKEKKSHISSSDRTTNQTVMTDNVSLKTNKLMFENSSKNGDHNPVEMAPQFRQYCGGQNLNNNFVNVMDDGFSHTTPNVHNFQNTSEYGSTDPNRKASDNLSDVA